VKDNDRAPDIAVSEPVRFTTTEKVAVFSVLQLGILTRRSTGSTEDEYALLRKVTVHTFEEIVEGPVVTVASPKPVSRTIASRTVAAVADVAIGTVTWFIISIENVFW